MRYRWLVALLCLTITACGKDGETGGDDAAKDKSETAKVESTPEVKIAKVEPKAEKEIAKVEPKAELPDAETPVLSAFEAQSKKFDDAMSEFMTVYRAIPEMKKPDGTPASKKTIAEARQKAMKDYPKADDYAKDMLALAAKDPKGDDAFDALLWVAQKTRAGESYDTAFEKLTTDFIDREELKDLVMGLGYAQPSEKTESLINLMIEKSPHDSVKGLATFAKANYLKRAQATLKRMNDSEDKSKQPEELMAYLESMDAEPMALEALYQSLIDDYGDIQPSPRRKSTLKDMATASLFEMNNLAIGMKVPEIQAEDIEGVEFKLSDYRGKVVVIDFWGDW